MRTALVLAGFVLMATAALADRQDVMLHLDDKVARIREAGGLEVLSVGLSEEDTMDVLSGADIEIAAMADGPDTTDLFGGAIVVAEITGTQSCEDGDPFDYYVIKLGLLFSDPQGPVTSCGRLAATIADGVVTLAADPARFGAASWTWASATGFVEQGK